jgi:hypothetical protein
MFPLHMFNIVSAIISIGFVLVFGIIISRFVKGAVQWNRNNHSPLLTVDARVISRRADVRHHSHFHGTEMGMHHTSSTSYYVTFEFESGDRLELAVPHDEYGYLVEGDYGRLTFQGTRYRSFVRT